MLWLSLIGCASAPPEPPPPAPVTAPTPAPPVTKVVTDPGPPSGTFTPEPTREAVTGGFDAKPGVALPADCAGACGPLAFRAQASTELAEEKIRHVADLALDGDPATAWCGIGGAGEQLSLALPGPAQLRSLRFLAATGAPRWRTLLLITDRRDRLVVSLPDAPEVSLELDLPGVQFVQIEAMELASEGTACIAEIALAGTHGPR